MRSDRGRVSRAGLGRGDIVGVSGAYVELIKYLLRAGPSERITLFMNNTKATKSQIKTLEARIVALRAEMTDEYTVSLGRAAVKCVEESLEAWTAELSRVRAA